MTLFRRLALSAAVGLALGAPALAQNVGAAQVGDWVYSAQGEKIGSVRAVGPEGVQIMVGAYFQPGSHAETVPARAFRVVDGRVVLQPEISQAARK